MPRVNETGSVGNDKWRTPRPLAKWLRETYRLDLDLCADVDSAVCKSYICAHEDESIDDQERGIYCVAVDALNVSLQHINRCRSFMNFPYSDPPRWLNLAHEIRNAGGYVIALMPHDTSAPWYSDHVFGVADEILMIIGRVSFELPPDATCKRGGFSKPSALAIYDGSRAFTSTEYKLLQVPDTFRGLRRNAIDWPKEPIIWSADSCKATTEVGAICATSPCPHLGLHPKYFAWVEAQRAQKARV